MATEAARRLLSEQWAQDGDRTDPDDASLTVPVSRVVGFPSTFSDAYGNQPPRSVWNQLFRERQGAARIGLVFGVSPYNSAVDYQIEDTCAVGRRLYHAVAANGPTNANAIHPTAVGQTAWAEIPGRIVAPTAPDTPSGEPGNGLIIWTWNCPRDGGRHVTEFEFQWRVSGTSNWSNSVSVMSAYFELTALQNGQTYEARVRARTSFAYSIWSNAGSATPAAVRPSKVPGLVALRGGNQEIRLRWQEPDLGGTALIRYEVQWRTPTQTFSSARTQNTTVLSRTIGGLVNGTPYIFRVRAVNGVGEGPYSAATLAVPAAPPPAPPVVPDDTTPGRILNAPTGQIIDSAILWTWAPPTDGGREIRFDVQVRTGSRWPSQFIQSRSSCHFQTSTVAGTTYQIRVRAVNNLGNGQWSGTGELRT